MAPSISSYEEIRKQRVEENKKRIEDLGILKLSKSLSELKKSPQKSLKPKLRTGNPQFDMSEVRRSSRPRNAIVSYSDEMASEFPRPRKRSKSKPCGEGWASYLARPIEEVTFASSEERSYAMKCAEKFQRTLPSERPSFVKSMLRSHVYSCFWLGLPADFCEKHLPEQDVTMVLEDTEGLECDAIYKAKKNGLSGGWRGFALDHKLDDGDALVFEHPEEDRFKVHIFKARDLHRDEAAKNSTKKLTKKSTKEVVKNSGNKASSQKSNKKADKKSKKEAVADSKDEDGEGSDSSAVQLKDELKFRKKKVSPKLFRRKKV